MNTNKQILIIPTTKLLNSYQCENEANLTLYIN